MASHDLNEFQLMFHNKPSKHKISGWNNYLVYDMEKHPQNECLYCLDNSFSAFIYDRLNVMMQFYDFHTPVANELG